MTAAPRDHKGVFRDDLPIRPSAWMLALAAGLSLMVVTFALAVSSRQSDVARSRPSIPQKISTVAPTPTTPVETIDATLNPAKPAKRAAAKKSPVPAVVAVVTKPADPVPPVSPALDDPRRSVASAIPTPTFAPTTSAPPHEKSPEPAPSAPTSAPVPDEPTTAPTTPVVPRPVPRPTSEPTTTVPAPCVLGATAAEGCRPQATVTKCEFQQGTMVLGVQVVNPGGMSYMLRATIGDQVDTVRSGFAEEYFEFAQSGFAAPAQCRAFVSS